MSDKLLDQLCGDLKPTSRLEVVRRLGLGVGLGAAASAVLIGLTLGFRPDMGEAARQGMFWVKLAYTLAWGGVALWSCERLSRPAGVARRRWPWLLAPVLGLAALAVWQLGHTPPSGRVPMLLGHTYLICPWLIAATSLAPLGGTIWAVRGLAPTRLRLTGAIVGLAAGGVGATVYALHCDESTAPFLVIWYTLGIGLAGAIGWLTGPRLLRW